MKWKIKEFFTIRNVSRRYKITAIKGNQSFTIAPLALRYVDGKVSGWKLKGRGKAQIMMSY